MACQPSAGDLDHVPADTAGLEVLRKPHFTEGVIRIRTTVPFAVQGCLSGDAGIME